MLFAPQAPAAPAAALGNVQMTCTLAAPSAPAMTVAVDLQTKKPGSAALVGDANGPWGRIGASSDAIAWPANDASTRAFTVATGNAQYRLELVFTGPPAAGAAKARLVALGGPGGPVRFAQGFCTARGGKRLAPKGLVRMPFDGTPAQPRTGATQVRAVPDGLTTGSCRLISPDRRIRQIGYTLTSASGNEASVDYRFPDADLSGVAAMTGTGVRFHLVTPTDRVVTMTQALPTATPTYLNTIYERSGTWIELIRAGQTLAWGECGPTPAALTQPLPGKTQP